MAQIKINFENNKDSGNSEPASPSNTGNIKINATNVSGANEEKDNTSENTPVIEDSTNVSEQPVAAVEDTTENDFDDNELEDITKTNEIRAKRYKVLKRRKTILIVLMFAFIIGLISWGTYNTMFRHNITGKEMAAVVNSYNRTTNFPADGVGNYISTNIVKLTSDSMTSDKNTGDYTVTYTGISKVSKKTDNIANVYFVATFHTSLGDEPVSCMITLKWDEASWSYVPLSKVIFTPIQATSSVTKVEANPLMSFDDIDKADKDTNDSAGTFVNNMFSILYSNGDISVYYKGEDKLQSDGLTFNSMDNFTLYKEDNKSGFNATADISLTTPNGLTYTTKKYMHIDRSGETWIIKSII